jgi:NAD(P)-dependent dehydrogenase (short-subunit alcohol dehydrogenase family)
MPSDSLSDGFFNGKVALVTGAASGIGRALAGALAARGATVVMADVDEVGAEAAADAIGEQAPGRAIPAGLDVTDAEAFASLAGQVAAEQGPVDLLFNNAGIGVGGPARDMTLSHWDRVIDVNLRGVVHGIAALYPAMCERGSGHIVNTASLAGLIPAPLLTPYAATKHAVVGLSTSLRAEAAAHGVRISVVCPGVIDTPLLDKGNPKDLPPTVELLNGRKLMSQIGRPYPPESLAKDVLAGVAANRAFIVSPRHARLPWRLHRLSPELFVRGLPVGMRRAMRILGSS